MTENIKSDQVDDTHLFMIKKEFKNKSDFINIIPEAAGMLIFLLF